MKKERGAPLAAKLCRVGQADGVRGTQRSDRRSEGAAAAVEEKKKSGERRNRSPSTLINRNGQKHHYGRRMEDHTIKATTVNHHQTTDGRETLHWG